jgi:hypothetical protein
VAALAAAMRPSVAFDMVGEWVRGKWYQGGIEGWQTRSRKKNKRRDFFSASTGFYGQLGLDPWQIKRNS